MYINGQAVLAENNYVLKGHSYSFGAFEATATKKRAEDKNGTVKKKARGRQVHDQEQVSSDGDGGDRRARSDGWPGGEQRCKRGVEWRQR